MVKDELLTLLRDADIKREILNIVRFGGKQGNAKLTGLVALKADLLFLLCDEDVRKSIVEIVKRAIKSSEIKPPAETPRQITTSGADVEVTALREKIRNRITGKPTVESAAAENPSEPNDTKFTYISEKTCPICESRTRIVQCKSRLVADTLDLDFCMHYKDFNPYLYSVWVCEICGYAADENRFQERYADKVRKGLQEFLSSNNMRTPFVEVRKPEQALAFYEAAIYFNEMFEPSQARQAGLYQKMAWICRIEGETDREREYLLKSAELYEKSLDSERYPVGKVSDTAATYIIAVNYFMLKDFDKASNFLGQIINNPNLRSTAPKIYEKARGIWQDMRQLTK